MTTASCTGPRRGCGGPATHERHCRMPVSRERIACLPSRQFWPIRKLRTRGFSRSSTRNGPSPMLQDNHASFRHMLPASRRQPGMKYAAPCTRDEGRDVNLEHETACFACLRSPWQAPDFAMSPRGCRHDFRFDADADAEDSGSSREAFTRGPEDVPMTPATVPPRANGRCGSAKNDIRRAREARSFGRPAARAPTREGLP